MNTKKLGLLTKIFCLFSLCVSSFAMEHSSGISGRDRETLIKIAQRVLDRRTSEFKNITELCFDASFRMVKLPVKFSPEDRIDQALLDDALRWMGGAVNYGKDHNYPEGARADSRFQALHIGRAATYYLEWYIPIKALSLALQTAKSEDDFGAILSYLKGFVSDTEIRAMLESTDNNNVQTKEEIANFGEFPPFNITDLVIEPLKIAIAALERAFPRLDSSNDSIKERDTRLDSKIKAALQPTSVWDKHFLDLTDRFIGFQYVKNHGSYIKSEVKEHQAAIDFFIKYRDAKTKNNLINKSITSKFTQFLDLYNQLDDDLEKAFVVSGPIEQPKIVSEEKETKCVQKQTRKKKRKSKNQRKNRTGIINSEKDVQNSDASSKSVVRENDTVTDLSSVVERHCVENTQKKSLTSAPALKKSKPQDNKKREKQAARIERYVAKHVKAETVTAKKSNVNLHVLDISVPCFTKEVVEKFLDIFGNEKGQQRNKLNGVNSMYKRQGWGESRDFSKTLKAAGWLIDQSETADGRIVNERHKSSTTSFEMPAIAGVPAIYLKFHGDHESNLIMREIARHFIIKFLEEAGYPEQFWIEYYKRHFS